MARPLKPPMEHVLPSDAEVKRGAVLDCSGCKRRWPMRLCVPSLKLCVNCARSWWREEKKSQTGHRWMKFGLSRKELRALLDLQDGECSICRINIHLDRKPRAHLDHDHSTGGPRGFLCARCNTTIGRFGDDPVLLASAARYLTERAGHKPRERPPRVRSETQVNPTARGKPVDFLTRTGETVSLLDANDLTRVLLSPHLRADLLAYLEALNTKSERLLKIEAEALKVAEVERMVKSADRAERFTAAAVYSIEVEKALAGEASRAQRKSDQIDLMIERAVSQPLPSPEPKSLEEEAYDMGRRMTGRRFAAERGRRHPPPAPHVPMPPEEKHDPNETIDSIVSRMGAEVIDMPMLPAPRKR